MATRSFALIEQALNINKQGANSINNKLEEDES
jgi:hypothetical protein